MKYYWNGKDWVLPEELEREESKRNPKYNMQIMNKFSGFNQGLGVPQSQVKETLNVIKQETGRELIETGNEKSSAKAKSDYSLTHTEKKEIYDKHNVEL